MKMNTNSSYILIYFYFTFCVDFINFSFHRLLGHLLHSGVGGDCRVLPHVVDLSRGYHRDFPNSSSGLPLWKCMDLHPCV